MIIIIIINPKKILAFKIWKAAFSKLPVKSSQNNLNAVLI
jgi:ribosomal protein S7